MASIISATAKAVGADSLLIVAFEVVFLSFDISNYQMSVLTLTIPGRPVSVNSAYVTSKCGRYRFLSKEANNYKAYVSKKLAGACIDFDKRTHALEVEYYFYLRGVLTKKAGTVSERSGDWDGFIKILQDAVFSVLKIDDSAICRASVSKLQAKEDCAVVVIKTMPLSVVTTHLTLKH